MCFVDLFVVLSFCCCSVFAYVACVDVFVCCMFVFVFCCDGVFVVVLFCHLCC